MATNVDSSQFHNKFTLSKCIAPFCLLCRECGTVQDQLFVNISMTLCTVPEVSLIVNYAQKLEKS